MDPNTTLEVIRQAIRYDGDLDDRLELIVEAFTALDDWLSNGGFVPRDWDMKGKQL